MIDFLRGVFRGKPLAHGMAWLAGLDVCFGPVNTLPEAFEDANVARARLVLKRRQTAAAHIAPAIRFRDEPAAPRLQEPALGAHTRRSEPVRRRRSRARGPRQT